MKIRRNIQPIRDINNHASYIHFIWTYEYHILSYPYPSPLSYPENFDYNITLVRSDRFSSKPNASKCMTFSSESGLWEILDKSEGFVEKDVLGYRQNEIDDQWWNCQN